MSKGYKKEYIDKVKQKFNDKERGHNGNNNHTSGKQNDQIGHCKSTSKLVVLERTT